jgi:hypothetical protein
MTVDGTQSEAEFVRADSGQLRPQQNRVKAALEEQEQGLVSAPDANTSVAVPLKGRNNNGPNGPVRVDNQNCRGSGGLDNLATPRLRQG